MSRKILYLGEGKETRELGVNSILPEKDCCPERRDIEFFEEISWRQGCPGGFRKVSEWISGKQWCGALLTRRGGLDV